MSILDDILAATAGNPGDNNPSGPSTPTPPSIPPVIPPAPRPEPEPESLKQGEFRANDAELARLKEEHELCKKLGITPPETWFRVGTRATGMERERDRVNALPLAVPALRKVAAQVDSEERKSTLLQAGQLRMSPEGQLTGPGLEGYLTKEALSHITGLLPFSPYATAGHLLGLTTPDGEPDLEWRSNHFNRILKDERNRDRTLKVLTRNRPGFAAREIYCVGSDQYAEYGSGQMARAMADAVELAGWDDARAEISYQGGHQLRARILSTTNIRGDQSRVGDVFAAGMSASTSDDKSKGLGVNGFIWMAVCINYTLGTSLVQLLKRKHKGSVVGLEYAVEQALRGGIEDKVRPFLERWEVLKERKVDVLETIRGVTGWTPWKAAQDKGKKWTPKPGSNVVAHVPGVHPDKMTDWILQAYQAQVSEGGEQGTAASLANAVSRVPHGVKHGLDPERVEDGLSPALQVIASNSSRWLVN